MLDLSPKPGELEPIETGSRDELAALQLERLRWSLRHAYDNVPFYRRSFDEAGVHPDDCRELGDLQRFPFTTKDDLRESYPFGMFAVPREQVVRIHASSGTTGLPTVVGYTKRDIDTWADVCARSIRAAGGRAGNIVHVAYGYGLFTGGLGAHYGAERLGCTVVPVSGGMTERQVRLIVDFEPDVIMVTPSYMLAIVDELERQGIEPTSTSLKVGIFGAEPWTEEMRREIELRLDMHAVDIYGLSEVIGPGVANECVETKDGLHVWEDHFYPEIVDPQSGDVLPDGERGELVFTSLTKEAMPVIRKDIVVKLPSMLTPRQIAPPPPKELGEYTLPAWDCLAEAEHDYAESQEAFVREKAAVLEQALKEFSIDAHVTEIDTGPVITMYELALAAGVKVSAISALTNDIQRALKAETIRIVAPIPGKSTVGIEVPNEQKEKVRLKELMQHAPDASQKMGIPIYLGKDASGEPLIDDLTKMPHCLIAGTTGSGKSVCINSIIMSIMYLQRPDRVKLILVDPKVVEMAPFKDIPHLMCPVINDAARATSVLEWACSKMDERYEYLAEAGVRNIKAYNAMTQEELIERFQPGSPEEEAKIPKKLPYIVIIVDELADLMMTSGKEVESHIVRIAQKARAVGIHLILATQRPQATVVTGLIKANMPCKIAFRVSSKMDSRIVLDQNGAEVLLGQGDMLFLPPGAGKPVRGQGTYIDDKEIKDSVKLIRELAEAQYEPELVQIKAAGTVDEEAAKDELFDQAVRVVLETKRGSVSLLQRRLTIGYSRASRLIEAMASAGIVGSYKGSQAREAQITVEEWEAMQAARQADAEAGMTV